MGVTKDLVTGVWVGCDEQSIHFKNSHTGEGSKTALPIFGMFLEELYKHPELGYTFGKFPDPTVEITKKYKCESPRLPERTESADSTAVDIPDGEILEGEGGEQNGEQPVTTPQPPALDADSTLD